MALDPVVDVVQPVLAGARVEVGQQTHVYPAQRRPAVIGDVELQPRDPVVARRAPGVRLLVHRQPQRLVVLPARIHRVHRLRPVVHVVRRQHLVGREPEVLVDLPVPVVVLPVQHLLVDPPVAVVVHQPARPRIPTPHRAHPVVLRQRRPPLQQRPARDVRPPRGVDPSHPQRGVVQALDSRVRGELERGVARESDVEVSVADDAGVGDAHHEVAGVEAGAAIVDVEHRPGRRGRDEEHGQRRRQVERRASQRRIPGEGGKERPRQWTPNGF